MRWIRLTGALLLLSQPLWGAERIPYNAYKYRRVLKQAVAYRWGVGYPTDIFFAQVEQESGWRENAHSAYAAGLAQFTPQTAQWIGKLYPDLRQESVYNPTWALLALATYDRYLFDRINEFLNETHRWAFTLSAYNGGLGGVQKDKGLARARGADPRQWWNHVARWSRKRPEAFRENRDYVDKIFAKRKKYEDF